MLFQYGQHRIKKIKKSSCLISVGWRTHSYQNGVVKTITFICISKSMSCAGNNYKLLLNDQNEFGVLDMIEWQMKYTELIDNVYVLKEMFE